MDKNHIIKVFLAFCIPAVTIIFWIWPREQIWQFFVNKGGASCFFALLLVLYFLGFLCGFLGLSKRKAQDIDLNHYINHNKDQKRYSVVLVDDMFKNQTKLNLYRDQLLNYSICFLPSVSDINMLVGFDVIILDVMGTGFRMGIRGAHGDVNAYIQELFAQYPFKYIVAVSTDREKLRQQEIVANSYDTIVKQVKIDQNQKATDDVAFIEELRKSMNRSFEFLDNPPLFWESISKKIPNKSKASQKSRYVSFLEMKGRNTQ